VILSMEEILGSFSTVLGCPISIEHALESQHTNDGLVDVKVPREKHVNSLAADFLHLLNNPELSDITFILRDTQRCFAHKNILISRSPYFRSLLMNGMKESFQTEITVTEWEPELFMAVLRFIYSDQVLFSTLTSNEFIWELYMAAKYYSLDRLARLCEQAVISDKISIETVCLLWNTASELDSKPVEQACIRFMEQNFEQIVKTDHYFILPKELFLYVLQAEGLVVSSQDVVSEAIRRWAKAQTDVYGVDTVSKQELFYQFFPLQRIHRKCPPINNVDIKNSVLELLKSAGAVGLRITRLVDKLKESFTADDVRKCVQLLQAEGQVQSTDGEHFIASSCTNGKRGLVECVQSIKRRRIFTAS